MGSLLHRLVSTPVLNHLPASVFQVVVTTGLGHHTQVTLFNSLRITELKINTLRIIAFIHFCMHNIAKKKKKEFGILWNLEKGIHLESGFDFGAIESVASAELSLWKRRLKKMAWKWLA